MALPVRGFESDPPQAGGGLLPPRRRTQPLHPDLVAGGGGAVLSALPAAGVVQRLCPHGARWQPAFALVADRAGRRLLRGVRASAAGGCAGGLLPAARKVLGAGGGLPALAQPVPAQPHRPWSGRPPRPAGGRAWRQGRHRRTDPPAPAPGSPAGPGRCDRPAAALRDGAGGGRRGPHGPAAGHGASRHRRPWPAQQPAAGVPRPDLLFPLSLALERAHPGPLDRGRERHHDPPAGGADAGAGGDLLALGGGTAATLPLVAGAVAGGGHRPAAGGAGYGAAPGPHPPGQRPPLSR